jgi:hypothetical protein
MPLLKANEPLPQRPVVIAIYGEPGSCKTTLGNTSNQVVVLDFDRGVSRSLFRQDTVIVNSWDDVIAEEQAGTFKNYKTVVIDTAKAALDDFLMSYVVKRDFKLKTNKLKAYGEIGDEFKLFLNNRRTEGLDVVIIAHAKKDEDTKKSIPDVTGQSYQLILRVADQVGYVSFQNNHRNIQWSPTDLTIGKNTANLPMMQVPDKTDPALKHFMANVIEQVKGSIVAINEAQEEAMKKFESIQQSINDASSFEDLGLIITVLNEQPTYLKLQGMQLMQNKGVEFITAVTTADGLNEALSFYLTNNCRTNEAQSAMKQVQEKLGLKFDKSTAKFFAPTPEPPVADEATGAGQPLPNKELAAQPAMTFE